VNLPSVTTQEVSSLTFWRDLSREPIEVAAYDNFPCFDGRVTQTDRNVTMARTCNSGILWHTNRTWSAVDKAGNRAQASILLSVRDDQVYDFGDIKVAVGLPWGSVPLYTQPFKIDPPYPNKNYMISLVPVGGGTTLTKQGMVELSRIMHACL
jgi:hypothetical protein